jgi:hypothetical protein
MIRYHAKHPDLIQHNIKAPNIRLLEYTLRIMDSGAIHLVEPDASELMV